MRRAGMGTRVLLAVLVAAAVGAGGCGKQGLQSDTATGSVTPGPVTVPATTPGKLSIQSFAFGPTPPVTVGQTISVQNLDAAPHTVTADDGHSFDVAVASNGTAAFVAPMVPGSYAFHCDVHPDMHGTLVVR